MYNELREIFCLCYPQFRMTEETFEHLMINDRCHILTRSEEGRTAGFAVVEGASLRLICVRPDLQRRGIGSGLLSEAENYAREKGSDKLLTGGVSSKFLIGADKKTAGFFLKHGYGRVGGCDEMLIDLSDFSFDENDFRGHKLVRYGWYNGDREALRRAVAEVEESWVQYFDDESRVFAAIADGEIAGFCIVDTDVKNYLSDAYGRVGMPGCVGTVPKYRNRGIGIELVARVTQFLKESGMDISFIFFTGAAGWYKKLGYEIFLTEEFMVKDLSE